LSIILALLFLFMSPSSDAPGSRAVDLAKTESPVSMRAALKEDALIVAVARDGMVFVGRDHIRLADLSGKIREGLSRGAEDKVYIKAAARAKYGTVKEALDGIRAAGVERVGFLVDQRKAPSSLP
jgi:biopolymer transport protein ExbD/biopolymer transport protein TolR